MRINREIATAAMEEALVTEQMVADKLEIKLKSARSLLRGEATTNRNQVIKLCTLLKVSFAEMKPVDIGGE